MFTNKTMDFNVQNVELKHQKHEHRANNPVPKGDVPLGTTANVQHTSLAQSQCPVCDNLKIPRNGGKVKHHTKSPFSQGVGLPNPGKMILRFPTCNIDGWVYSEVPGVIYHLSVMNSLSLFATFSRSSASPSWFWGQLNWGPRIQQWTAGDPKLLMTAREVMWPCTSSVSCKVLQPCATAATKPQLSPSHVSRCSNIFQSLVLNGCEGTYLCFYFKIGLLSCKCSHHAVLGSTKQIRITRCFVGKSHHAGASKIGFRKLPLVRGGKSIRYQREKCKDN